MATLYSPLLLVYLSLILHVPYRVCMPQCSTGQRQGVIPESIGEIHIGEVGSANVDRRGQFLGHPPVLNMRQIRFEPAYLDFQQQCVGMPKMRSVIIHNPKPEQSLQLQSISGSTVHFHSSFFQSKVVPPLGNTTFDVVFLPRMVGNVENTLFIHTSVGAYPYQVFGVGVINPYRLRPFIGARVPLNLSFSSVLNMHNPFDKPLQVLEMYSSGGDLHLELPSGQEEAPQKLWEIPPYETKPVMRVSFMGRVSSNHTAFIRIKTSHSSTLQNEYLILPVEVEVTSAPGIFSSVELIDFGTLRTMDEPKSVGLYLLVSGTKSVHIMSCTVDPPNSAVSIQFNPVNLKSSHKYLRVGTVTYTGVKAKSRKQWTGKIVLKGANKQSAFSLEIPYQVNLLQGTLAYSVTKTRFFVGKPPFQSVVQDLPITNTFNFTMIVYDAAFPPEVREVFSITNFSSPVLIPAQSTFSPFSIHFQANSSDLTFSTILRVYTNASIFTIPIHCYDGKLKYSVDEDEDTLDFGVVSTNENRTRILTITNLNPVEVTISNYSTDVKFLVLKLLDVKITNSSRFRRKGNSTASWNELANVTLGKEKFTIRPGHVVTFLVEVFVPKEEGQYLGEVLMGTEFETLHIPIYLKAVMGRLESKPKEIIFTPTFPGHVEEHGITLHNTFSSTLRVVSVNPVPLNPQFFYIPSKNVPPDIPPGKKMKVGSIVFNPLRGCEDLCYAGLDSTFDRGLKWKSSFSISHDVLDIDSQYLESLRTNWATLQEQGKTRLNVTFAIDTDIVKGYKLSASASLTWPALTPDKPIRFPLTHVGNYSVRSILLENPSDSPVLAQVVPLSQYPQQQGLLDLLADRLEDSYGLERQDHSCFSLPTLEDYKTITKDFDLPPDLTGLIEEPISPSTFTVIIQPRMRALVPILFNPKDELPRSSLFLIRNNLTVLDNVVVHGQGAKGEFTINGKKPNTDSFLLFELKATHLADCNRSSSRSRNLPPIIVKKTLTAANTGQLAVHVRSLLIGGYECEGFGFKILNCKSFILRPNTSRRIEIMFTPDFSMARVTQELQITTSEGPVLQFMLVATIPPHLLPVCSNSMARPEWEAIFHIGIVSLMCLLLITVIIAAYTEAYKITVFSRSLLRIVDTTDEKPAGKVFDLNAIPGVKTLISFKTSKRESSTGDELRQRQVTPPAMSVQNTRGNNVTANKVTNNNLDRISSSTVKTRSKSEPLSRSPPQTSSDHDKKLSPTTSELPKSASKLVKEIKKSPKNDTKLDTTTDSPQRKSETIRPEKEPVCMKVEDMMLNDSKDSIHSGSEDSLTGIDDPTVDLGLIGLETTKKRDGKEIKIKAKKKSKAQIRREEKMKERERKDSKLGNKDTEDSSDTSSDKSAPTAKMNQSENSASAKKSAKPTSSSTLEDRSKEKTVRAVSLPSTPVLPKHSKVVETAQTSSKNKKVDTSRPRNLELGLMAKKAKSYTVEPNSPHAIAAQAMSVALTKSLHSLDNNNTSADAKNKLPSTKAFSPLLDSTPPLSPAPLSGSSRSSSYSSVLSTDSSSGSERTRTNGKGKSKLPPHLVPSPIGSDRPVFRPVARQLHDNPWSMSLNTEIRSQSLPPIGQKPKKPEFSPGGSDSLFACSSIPVEDRSVNKSKNAHAFSYNYEKRPYNFSEEEAKKRNPILSLNMLEPKPRVHSPSTCNNWVNFLDAEKVDPNAVSAQIPSAPGFCPSSKTMAEIWNTSSSSNDGWSSYSPGQVSVADGRAASEGPDVMARFVDHPLIWSSSTETEEFAPSREPGQEIPPWSPRRLFSSFWNPNSGSKPEGLGEGGAPEGELYSSLGSLTGNSIWGSTSTTTTWSNASK